MKRDRRWVLKTLGAGLAAGCTATTPDIMDPPVGSDPPSTPTETGTDLTPDPYTDGMWEPVGEPDWDRFPRGVQTGDVQAASAILGVRDDGEPLTFEVIEQLPDRWRVLATVEVAASQLGYRFELDRLLADTEYRWIARTDGARSVVGRFRTPPADDVEGIVRFGAVSCLGGNEPWPMLSHAAAQNLDVFLFLGDTVYADWGPIEPVADKWDHAMALDGMVDLCSSTSIIATWDDHEVDNNWSPQFTPQAEIQEARRAFRDAMPQREGPGGSIWRRLRWGATVDFFVLDCRSERAPGQYLSEAQLDWLTDGLSSSDAVFKIVLNSVPATDLSFLPIVGVIEADDRWQGYPAQRDVLMEAAGAASGVLFVSGDFHVGAATFVDPTGEPGASVMEVLAGPGGSAVAGAYRFLPTGSRLPRLVPELNYCSFVCDPTERTIRVEWVDDAGAVLDSLTINFS